MAKVIGLLAMFGLAVAVTRSAACSDARRTDAPAKPVGVEPGKELRTKRAAVAGNTTIFLDRALTLIRAKTTEALVPMIAAGQVAMLDQGTSVRVIQTSWTAVEVRALSGPRAGEHWWVERDCLLDSH